MPAIIRTMQPTPSSAVPRGAGWVHELKHDGWRIVARIAGGTVHLAARTGRDYTRTLAPIAAALGKLPCREAIIDGEVAAPDERGVTRVTEVRGALRQPERLVYYAFDLLWQNGQDLRDARLLERKLRLELLLLRGGGGAPLVYVEHVPAEQGKGLYAAALAAGCEGIVSKLASSRYQAGDTRAWLKIKPPEVRARQAEAIRKGFERAARRRGIKA